MENKNIETSATIYDFAKMMVNGKPPMSQRQVKTEIKKIAKAIKECPQMIFLMICPDLRQYVVFQVVFDPETKRIADDLMEVLENRGTILDIDDSAADQEIWEIWIRDKYNGEVYMYQLTNYEKNVVYIG